MDAHLSCLEIYGLIYTAVIMILEELIYQGVFAKGLNLTLIFEALFLKLEDKPRASNSILEVINLYSSGIFSLIPKDWGTFQFFM